MKKKGKFNTIKGFLKGSKLYFTVSIIASLLITLINMIIPKIVSVTVDSVIGDKAIDSTAVRSVTELFGGINVLKSNIWIPAAIVVSLGIISALFRYSNVYFNSKGAEKLSETMRNRLFEKIEHLPFDWHMKNKTGDIIQRCTSDTETIRTFIADQLTEVFKIIIIIVLALVFLFSVSAPIAIIALVSVPVIIGYSFIFYRKISSRFAECDENEGVLSAIAQENLTGVRVVRAFGKEKYEKEKFEKQNAKYTNTWMELCKLLAYYWGIGDVISGLQIMLVVVVGTQLCVGGSLTTGEFIAACSYNALLTWPVRRLGRILSEMSKTGVSISRIAYIMDSEEEKDAEKQLTPDMHSDIEFNHVSFAYDESPILKDVSFKVKGGSVLGILGGTGSGKSTVTLLLGRLYGLKPECGSITVDGVNINDIKGDYLRSNIGIVLQEPFLFSRTLAENIGITKEKYTPEDIESASRIACLDDAVKEFSNGYDTVVGERGVTLSGGQKQRAAIARILMQKSPIMIFDDSLSAVDAETDEKIRESLKKSFENSTVILISHRITTLMDADNIIVLDKGAIVEQGTHDTLIAQNGIYSRIYSMQTGLEE